MSANDPILEAWRDGVRLLKARPASNPVSWANFAAIHGDANSFNLCPHGNWYFLPWHRAYLLTYERAVRQLTASIVQAEPGSGQFLARGPYDLIKPTGNVPFGFDASAFLV